MVVATERVSNCVHIYIYNVALLRRHLTCCIGNGIIHCGIIAVQAAPAIAVDGHFLPHPLEVGCTVIDACNGI